MEDPVAAPIRCSGCGGAAFTADTDGVPTCDYCGTICASSGRGCPRCGTAFDPGARSCVSCGTPVSRECPICGTVNPLVARRCVVCSQTFDATDAMFARLTTRVPDQLKRVRQTGAEIKVQEDRASEARLAQMWAAEDRWREEQEDAQARREQRERLMITLAISLIVVAIVAMIIIAVVTGSSTSAPLPPLSSAIYASGAALPGRRRARC